MSDLKLKEVFAGFTDSIELPVFSVRIPAGFPSPADGEPDQKIDLNKYLIKNASSTFFYFVEGHSMADIGIHDKSLLIVDASLEPQNNDIIVGVINGEFTVKQISKINNKLYLLPKNSDFKPIEITEFMNFQLRGVVTKSINSFRK